MVNISEIGKAINEIYLRRRNKFLAIGEFTPVQLTNGYQITQTSLQHVATINKNIETYGYTLSMDYIQSLLAFPTEQLEFFSENLMSAIKTIKSDSSKFQPMYPNFPEQVMEMDETTLYINAIIHYITLGTWMPEYEKDERPALQPPNNKLQVIGIGHVDDFQSIFNNIMSSTISMSPADREDLFWYVNTFKGISPVSIPEMPNRENKAYVLNLLWKNGASKADLSKMIDTATDVLRLAVAASDGDVSLADDKNFVRFTRKQRRTLLYLLNKIKNPGEDMQRYPQKWKRLGERIHPGEPKHRQEYPNAAECMDKLRSGIKMPTFYSKLESIGPVYDDGITRLLSTRPGEFARRLDYLLRNNTLDDQIYICEDFDKVAGEVSIPTLLQIMAHFSTRNDVSEDQKRFFFIKGQVSNIRMIDSKLPAIHHDICKRIYNICSVAILTRFLSLPVIGDIWVDPELKNYTVPFSLRNASKSVRSYGRGSRIAFDPNAKFIRSFIFWKDANNGRTDIDLSASAYSEDWDYVSHVSFTNLRESYAQHSGDVTSAPQGASEFIDIDIDKAYAQGIRYIVFSMYAYTSHTFDELPECFFGWMERSDQKSGEIYEPRTVKNSSDITSSTTSMVPVILDLQNHEFIWVDAAVSRDAIYENRFNTIESTKNNISLIGKVITTMVKPNLYDLFKLHAQARGTLVDTREEADFVFGVDQGDVTPHDVDIITGQLM